MDLACIKPVHLFLIFINRRKRLEVLCRVMGLKEFDPDETYELTMDNVMKILAIHMRFRYGANISHLPVASINSKCRMKSVHCERSQLFSIKNIQCLLFLKMFVFQFHYHSLPKGQSVPQKHVLIKLDFSVISLFSSIFFLSCKILRPRS